MKTIAAIVARALGLDRTSVTSMKSLRRTIDGLSAIERPAAGVVCLERFAHHFGIEEPELTFFVQHLWGIFHVTPETWLAWADAFDDMVILKSGVDYPAAVATNLPAAVRQDFATLTRAVFETTAATWYCSNPDGTRDALLEVIGVLRKHNISVPDLTLFSLSSENNGDSWGPNPSEEIVARWKAMARPNNAFQRTLEDSRR